MCKCTEAVSPLEPPDPGLELPPFPGPELQTMQLLICRGWHGDAGHSPSGRINTALGLRALDPKGKGLALSSMLMSICRARSRKDARNQVSHLQRALCPDRSQGHRDATAPDGGSWAC